MLQLTALLGCAAALAPPMRMSAVTAPPAPGSWAQARLTVTAPKRGCHLITGDVERAIGPELRSFKMGLCHIFVRHTSCSLTINENCDPTVREDMERALREIEHRRLERELERENARAASALEREERRRREAALRARAKIDAEKPSAFERSRRRDALVRVRDDFARARIRVDDERFDRRL